MDFNIRTERLVLRPPALEDSERLFCLMTEENLTRYLTWEPHYDIEQTKYMIKNLIMAQQEDKGYHWCVTLNKNIVGLVSLIDVKRKIRTWTLNRAELSYWIGNDFQGKGYATEASRGVVKFGFDKLVLHKIVVAHVDENIQSENICNKLGFSRYAHEHDAFYKNKRWYDLLWYELLNPV